MKVVINTCYGGFGLSDAAYEKLIEYGVPVRAHVEQDRDPATRLYLPQPANEGEVIFDRSLDTRDCEYGRMNKALQTLSGRYWDMWIEKNRSHPLLVRVVEEIGAGHRTGASGKHAHLKVVEIPDGIEWEIDEYDGLEKVCELHRTWS